jgi:hypothetical protein
MAAIFLVFTVAVAIATATLLIFALRGAARIAYVLGLVSWLAFTGGVGVASSVFHVVLPVPLLALLAGPSFTLALAVALSPLGRGLALQVPMWALMGLQTFRLGIELSLYPLAKQGLIPEVATFLGGNIDIIFGLTAPVMAWLAHRGRAGPAVILTWNVLGILSVCNAGARSALTAPGALHLIHTSVANQAMGQFPYTFIPAFLAPLALMLHIVAIRAALGRGAGEPGKFGPRDGVPTR